MNACKAIELAMKDTLAKYARVGAGVWLRCEQSQVKDDQPEEYKKAGREFPQVWMMASPEHADEAGWTFQQALSIGIATMAPDDPYCQTRAEIYEAVRGVISFLYFQALDPSIESTPELDFFTAKFSGYLNGGDINIGGITLPNSSAPGFVGEVQTMAVELTFHWSQTYTPTTTPQG